MLLEAMIATVLVGVIGVGMTYVAARSAAAQRIGNAQNLTVGALRSQLQSVGFADGCPATGANELPLSLQVAAGVQLKSVKKSCSVTGSTVTVSGIGKTVKVPHVEFRAIDQDRFGSDDALLLRN